MGPVFLGGDGRSGTTLLALLLHMHPHLSMMVELHFAGVKSLLNNRQFLARAERNGFDTAWMNHHLLHWPSELETFEEKCAFVEFLGREFMPSPRGTWGLKIMREIRCPERYAEVWPDAKFICIVRDPRDVYASQKQWPSWGYTSAHEAGKGWASIIQGADAFRSSHGDQLRFVMYEDVVSDPNPVIPGLWDWLGFTDWPEHVMLGNFLDMKLRHPMLESRVSHYSKEQLRGSLTTAAVGRWKNDLTEAEAREVIAYAGVLVKDFGYV